MNEKISDERLRNTRGWAAARLGDLSGAEVIVGAIDELLELRATRAPGLGDNLVDALKASIADGTLPNAKFAQFGDDARKKMADALRTAASALESGAEHISGGLLIDVEQGDMLVLLADLRLRYRPPELAPADLRNLQPGDIVKRKGTDVWWNVEYAFREKIVVKQTIDVMAHELHAWEKVNEYGRTIGAERTPA